MAPPLPCPPALNQGVTCSYPATHDVPESYRGSICLHCILTGMGERDSETSMKES